MNIVEFIEARIDEDEEDARAAAGWDLSGRVRDDGLWSREGVNSVVDSSRRMVVYGDGPTPGDAQVDHIARHDPARVLRQCAALREWLERAKPFDDCRGHPEPWLPHGDYGPGYCRQPDDSEDLCVLAAIWSDHPDYQQEWT